MWFSAPGTFSGFVRAIGAEALGDGTGLGLHFRMRFQQPGKVEQIADALCHTPTPCRDIVVHMTNTKNRLSVTLDSRTLEEAAKKLTRSS